MKFRAVIRSLTGFAASIMMIGGALSLDSQNSHADMQPMAMAYTPMQPVIQTEPALPKPRPDPALAYDLQPVEIALPHAKPSLHDILPLSTLTLAETIKAQTGYDTTSESIYKLRAGEGVGAILKRAGYSAAAVSYTHLTLPTKRIV